MTSATEKQRDILRHALGVGRGRSGWRNHFVTGPGSDDYADCEALVAAGLMTKRSGGPLSGGDPVYRYTHNAQQEQWFAGSWGAIGYGGTTYTAPDNCTTTIEY